MDKRRVVLVVEDDELYRESLSDSLESEGFRVEACRSLPEALYSLDALTPDVALVDIGLAGHASPNNRDGLEVLAKIRDLGEGTRALALSSQTDVSLPRDILLDYQAHDYLVREKTPRNVLLKKVREEIKVRPSHPQSSSWGALVRAISPNLDEPEFVDRLLRNLSFARGQSYLQDSLLGAAKWLAPLLTPAGGPRVWSSRATEVNLGQFWSKGQGCAVEIAISGKNKNEAREERASDRSGIGGDLYRRNKGGLTSIVRSRPDLQRADFVVD